MFTWRTRPAQNLKRQTEPSQMKLLGARQQQRRQHGAANHAK